MAGQDKFWRPSAETWLMKTERLIKVLENIQPLSAAFKEALTHEFHVVNYPKNHFIVQIHSIAHNSYFLEKGFAVSYYYAGGRKIVTRFFKPGEIIISPKSFFRQIPAEENIQLTVDSELLSYAHRTVQQLLSRFEEPNFIARAIISDYHAMSNENVVDLHTLSAWERYQKLIQKYPGIEHNVSQDLIASYLNITPQSLSRLRHERN